MSLSITRLRLLITRERIKAFNPDQSRDEQGRFGEGSNPATTDLKQPVESNVPGASEKIRHNAVMKPIKVFPSKDAAYKEGMRMRREGRVVFLVAAKNQAVHGVSGLTGRQAMLYE